MAVRRRHHMREDNALRESLLDDHDSTARPLLDADEDEVHPKFPQHHPRGGPAESSGRELMIYQGPFNVDAFIHSIMLCWQRLLSALTACLSSVTMLMIPSGPPAMSLIQAQRIEWLRDKIAQRYIADELSHQALLRQLWILAFPGIPCTSLKSAQWKDMGWQGEDPGTDFRGAGIYGLECLLYLAEAHPALFRRLLLKTEGTRAEWEYPFAVAGLNLTFMLSEVLDLKQGTDKGRLPSTKAGRSFLALLSDSPSAFEELYCCTFQLLDREWLHQKAGYMEFNMVLKAVKAEVEAALHAQPMTLSALRHGLLQGSHDLDVQGPDALSGFPVQRVQMM